MFDYKDYVRLSYKYNNTLRRNIWMLKFHKKNTFLQYVFEYLSSSITFEYFLGSGTSKKLILPLSYVQLIYIRSRLCLTSNSKLIAYSFSHMNMNYSIHEFYICISRCSCKALADDIKLNSS